MKKLLEVKNLYKELGEESKTVVLKGINLQVERGEYVVIMGQSGSGKSTLLYNISGMDKVTSGEVLFEGERISAFSDEQMSQLRLHKMGFIFQHSYLLKNRTLKDNVLLPARKAKKYSSKEITERGMNLMTSLQIDHVASHTISQVSGGQLQRAAICRALINEPSVLFADEPTGALNASATEEVMNILNTINQQGTTIVLVTHDARVAARGDRIIYLRDGVIGSTLTLDKYKKGEEQEREEKTNCWLRQQGF